MLFRWTFGRDPLKFCEWSSIKYDKIGYGVTMDLLKKSFIEPAESYPKLPKLKITLRKEFVSYVK